MFRRKKEHATVVKPVLETVYRDKEESLKNHIDSILESKTGFPEETRVSWWGWIAEFVYTEQRPSVEIAADVIKVFQKYFPRSKVNYTSAKVIIQHPEYGEGNVPLDELKIDEVLDLFQSGYVKKLLIHKNESAGFNKSLRLSYNSGKGVREEHSYLELYIPTGSIQKSTPAREYIHKSPKGPICVELFISPSIKRTRPLIEKIYYELSAIKNPVLQNTNTEQFFDTSSLFKD